MNSLRLGYGSGIRGLVIEPIFEGARALILYQHQGGESGRSL